MVDNAAYNMDPPVVSQPTAGPEGLQKEVMWMDRPAAPIGCPRGMEYLTQIDQLIIKQKVNVLETVVGWQEPNRYKIINTTGQQVYQVKEDDGAGECHRQCCGPYRTFNLHVTDNNGDEVMQVYREFKCCAGCCWCASADCAADQLEVRDVTGQKVGGVRQERSFCDTELSIRDWNNETVALIKGPVCKCACINEDLVFEVVSTDGKTNIGHIKRKWPGLAQDIFTDADNFGISFPMDLDARIKAAFIGAVFLIDYMFFEDEGNGGED